MRSAFVRSGGVATAALLPASATLSQGQVHILWQAQHFCKVRRRFLGRHCASARLDTDLVAFAWSSTDFQAGATLSTDRYIKEVHR